MGNQVDARLTMFRPTLRRLVGGMPWFEQSLKGTHAALRRMQAKARRRQALEVLIAEATFASGELGFVAYEYPVLSIIVSSDQGLPQILSCLRSIAGQSISIPFEVSLHVQPGSALRDDDRIVLESIAGLQLVFNTVSFQPAEVADTRSGGEAILWLDARCVLLKGAVNAMLESLAGNTVMSTPCILSPDGFVVQGVLGTGDADGAASVDQGTDWRDSFVNFRRRSDFGSALCAMWSTSCSERVKRSEAGLQLCLPHQASAAEGIVYQPVAKVVAYGFPSATQAPLTPQEKATGKSLLIVEFEVPEIDRNAGARNVYEFARTLIADGWTVKYWPMNSSAKPEYVKLLTDLGIEVPVGDLRPSFGNWIKARATAFDYLLVCRPDVARFHLSAIRKRTQVPVVYYGHDLHYARMEMQARVLNDNKMLDAAGKMKVLEEQIWRSVDLSLYPTVDEVDFIRSQHSSVRVEPVTIFCFDDFLYRDRVPRGEEILFVAGFRHGPNADSAIWFTNQIFPKILAVRSKARLVIIGSYPPQQVLDLASDNIDVRGWVSDDELQAAYLRAKVSVVPLLFGAGLKLKTVEALTRGTPLVTTTVGAQGLEELDSIATVADDPEAFAAGVIEILQCSDDAWMERSHSQVIYAKARFGRERMLSSLLDAFKVARDQRMLWRNGWGRNQAAEGA